MRDIQSLRDQIARAVLVFPVSAAIAACGNDEPKPSTPVDVPNATASVGTASSATSTSPPASASAVASTTPVAPAIDPIPPPSLRTGGCPSGGFCAPKSMMTKLAKKGTAQNLGCPVEVEVKPGNKAPIPDAMRQSTSNTFSEERTKAERADASAADSCCYSWVIMCPGGRPLVDGDAVVVAKVRAGSSWSPRIYKAYTPTNDPKSSQILGQLWLTDALAEHASVASFARTTLELMAVGAPIQLVSECTRAALDEVRHAERCFEIARAYGVECEPGALPALAPRETDLARLARDTFVEGCVGETISALAAMRAQHSEQTAPKEVAATWRMLASDEARHAALAWKTLAWILSQKQADFARELLAFAEAKHAQALATHAPFATHAHANEPALPGRLSARESLTLTQEAWREIILPTLHAMVNEQRASGA